MPTDDTTVTANTSDLNLDLNFDDLPKVETSIAETFTAPAPSLAVSSAGPITLTTETANDLYPVNLNFDNTQTAIPAAEAQPATETIVEPIIETPKQETNDSEATEPTGSASLQGQGGDDRLKTEDKIVEQSEIPLSTTEEKTPTTQTENTNTEIKTELPTDLKADQKIIDELTSIPTNTTITTENVPVVASTFNLDSIMGTAPTSIPEPVVAPLVVPIVEAPIAPTFTAPAPSLAVSSAGQVAGSVFNIPNIVEIAPSVIPSSAGPITTPTPSPIEHKSTKKIVNLILIIGLVGAGAYILKVMYPLEYANLQANVTGIFQSTNITNTNTSLENIIESTGIVAPVENIIQTGTDTSLLYGNTGTTPIIDPSTQILGSTSGFNGFEDLEGILTGDTTTPLQTQNQLDQLKKFADEAKAFVDLGTKVNDKIMLKYSTYVYKKASSLVQSIENKEQIDNAKIDSYISQFSGYLDKLTNLSYDQIPTSEIPAVEPAAAVQENIPSPETNNMIQDINWETGAANGQVSETGSIPIQP